MNSLSTTDLPIDPTPQPATQATAATRPRQVPRERPVDYSPAADHEARRTQQNQPAPAGPDLPRPAFGTLPGPCTWLFAGGRVSASLAADHFGERDRVVIIGPRDPARLAALLAALELYCAPPAPAAG